MLVDFVDQLGNAVSGIGTALVDSFDAVGGIFYDSVANTLTIPGILIVIALAVGLLKFGLNLILRLFTRIR